MHTQARSFRKSPVVIGLALLATITLMLSLASMVRPSLAFADDGVPGGAGQADCPAGTVFIHNFDQSDLVEGLELTTDVFITAVTEDDNNQVESVTVSNESDASVTIAVKGGDDQGGNFVTIAAGGEATISVDDNPTISNLSVCAGPEASATPTPTPEGTPGGETPSPTPEVTLTPEVTPTPTPEGSVDAGTPTPEATPAGGVSGGVLGGNPTPAGGQLPNTAADGLGTSSAPAALFALLALLSLGALLSVRLTKAPTRR